MVTWPSHTFVTRGVLRWTRFEPLLDGLRVAVRQQIDDTAALQVHDNGAVSLPLAPRPVVDADEPWRRQWAVSELLDAAEPRVGAGRHGQAPGETGAGFAAQRRSQSRRGFAGAGLWSSQAGR